MYFLVRNINDARATMKNRTISSEAITSSYIQTCIDIYLLKKSVNERASEQKKNMQYEGTESVYVFLFFSLSLPFFGPHACVVRCVYSRAK